MGIGCFGVESTWEGAEAPLWATVRWWEVSRAVVSAPGVAAGAATGAGTTTVSGVLGGCDAI